MSRAALIALIGALCLPLAAPSCGGGGGGGSPAGLVYFDPAAIEVPRGGFAFVDVVVSSSWSLQAYEFSVESDPAVAIPWVATADGDFDDDGQLFLAPAVKPLQGQIENVVDLRHGATSSYGTVRIARLQLFGVAAGSTALSITMGGAATPTGESIALSPFSANVTVVP